MALSPIVACWGIFNEFSIPSKLNPEAAIEGLADWDADPADELILLDTFIPPMSIAEVFWLCELSPNSGLLASIYHLII